MIIEIEDRFGKAAEWFAKMTGKCQLAAKRGDALHSVEEVIWSSMLEMGRELIIRYIEMQDESLPRPKVIEHEGKRLRRLPKRRQRKYRSVFGLVPIERDVYAARETQRQEVVPLDARLGLPESNVSYLLQKWCGANFVKESYQETRATMQGIFGNAPSVDCMEDMAAGAAEYADAHFKEQAPVDPATEDEILVVTSDGKGVPMRKIDAPGKKKPSDDASQRKRLGKGEKNGRKRMACVGGVYSVAPFRRTADDILDEILRKETKEQRPKPKNKRLRAVLTRTIDGQEVNGKDVVFGWLAKEVQQRDPQERRTVVAIMDGEMKLRELQEQTMSRAIIILDIWHATEYLWKLAYCFHPEGSAEAEAFVETHLRKLLDGKVRRMIGGIRRMKNKCKALKQSRARIEQYVNYFAERCDYMKYDEYLTAGYPIGSGVVEGACRHLVKDRMERTGMRWRIDGAQAILSLRAIYLNDNWDTFHADRIQAEQKKIHPYKSQLNAILNCAT
jgi:hypothetical protein